jgi:hypothetical protein
VVPGRDPTTWHAFAPHSTVQADELAARFEPHEPDTTDDDAAALCATRKAFQARADANETSRTRCQPQERRGTRGPRSARWSVPQEKPRANATVTQRPSADAEPLPSEHRSAVMAPVRLPRNSPTGVSLSL